MAVLGGHKDLYWFGRASADNSKNYVSTTKATRARVKLITTKVETTTLTLAFNSLRAKLQ